MKRMLVAATALAAFAVALAAQQIGAHGEHAHSLKNLDDSIAVRMYLMENVGANAKQLKAKLDAGQITDAALNAGAIALHASQIPNLFPPGSTSDSSRAKPEIWQQWDDFVQSAHGLRDAAEELGHAASQDNGDEAKAKLKAVFGSCKGCHDGFRKPKES
jgi:cytochrome c556